MTIDAMIEAIEARVCVRKIWRCNMGWGMTFVLTEAQAAVHFPINTSLRTPKVDSEDYKSAGTVFAYYPTLEACVGAEHGVWVEGKSRAEVKPVPVQMPPLTLEDWQRIGRQLDDATRYRVARAQYDRGAWVSTTCGQQGMAAWESAKTRGEPEPFDKVAWFSARRLEWPEREL